MLIAGMVTACDNGSSGLPAEVSQPIEAVDTAWSSAQSTSSLPTCGSADAATAETCHRVVYQGIDGLRLVNADGSQDVPWRPVGVTGRANHPDWSPDGLRLAFIVDEADETTVIWVALADGSGVDKLVDCVAPCGFVEEPAWSPDGTQIAYFSNGDTYTDELRITDVATGETVRVVRPPESTGLSHPRWSPDGTRISADTGVYSSTGMLASMSVGVYDLSEAAPVPTIVTGAESPANFADWSPDGSMIAYQGGNADPFAGDSALSDIFISSPDGSNVRRHWRRP